MQKTLGMLRVLPRRLAAFLYALESQTVCVYIWSDHRCTFAANSARTLKCIKPLYGSLFQFYMTDNLIFISITSYVFRHVL